MIINKEGIPLGNPLFAFLSDIYTVIGSGNFTLSSLDRLHQNIFLEMENIKSYQLLKIYRKQDLYQTSQAQYIKSRPKAQGRHFQPHSPPAANPSYLLGRLCEGDQTYSKSIHT